MIRQSLEVVPTVQPKHRLEEDARRAARREQQHDKPISVDRYTIVSSPEAATGVRLFSLLPSPELQSRVPKTLHVLETSKKTWKRVRRMVYRATLRNVNPDEDTEDDEDEDEADGSGPRFSSLPLPEYENMSCIFLTLPTEEETSETATRVVYAKPLDVPLHALRYERTEAAKPGQGISTSWYSGVDVRNVGFKRSYIDDDEDDDGNMHRGYFSDDGATEGRQGGSKREDKTDGRTAAVAASRKKKKLEETNNIPLETGEEGTAAAAAVVVVTENKLEPNGVLKLANNDAPVSSTASITPQTSEEEKKKKNLILLDGSSSVEGNVLERLTASQLQEWSAEGKAAMPFTELTKIVLKSHPHYAEMKAKHQSPQGRQEAVKWFSVSQIAVRKHVLHLGYTIDSSNNVYLSQQKKG
ncbi:uncharacterized protein TM35_000221110 [Trypanosoma theileri]|uniref:Uncharacterized protein n=1 Tax=Trypanosoma theileri TaxID=67003 RepID=A0A1X0NRH9_9TRYP|nr:uncharacterized protein TM35_000221110 [Trypanosoma theileri]ORC87312.1 hypothetical protein TM35_000221110 [Trypanosoma theileri]